MSSVDERVVAMKMDYASLDKGVSASTSALDKLKKALTFDKESKSIQDLDAAGKKFSLASIGDGVEAIASKFGALSIIGITALANIANKAVDAGLTIMRSLTVDPVKAGFDEYELKMGSIQTILANTARYGTQLPEVTANLEKLNDYADKTIYNFGDMTKNIGLFTNAGIKIDDATSMIKGFSNEAAASGTSAQGAAGAAYQLSQALSAGTVRLMDWRSLQYVGMGNKNMQNGLIEIADAMGTLTANSIDAATVQKDFNGSLEKNWLSADVMSTYLKIMAGEYDAASMAALGLSQEQIAAFQAQAKMGEDAATKVRTWTQLIGTLQESVGSGWSETFDLLIGDFDTATELWTGVNDKLGPIIDGMSDARNEFIKAFVEAGGRDAVIGTLSSAFDSFMRIVKTLKGAWDSIFPPATGAQIADIAKQIQAFVESLRPSTTVLGKLRSVAQGAFAVLDIGRMIVVQVIGLFQRLLGETSGLGGGILDVAANIGEMLLGFRNAIKNGDGLTKTFEVLGDVLAKPIEWLRKLGELTVNTLSLINFRDIWEGIAEAIGTVGRFLEPAVQWIKEAFSNIKTAVSEFFKTMDFNVLIGLLNVGAIGTVAVLIKKGFDKIVDAIGGIFKGGGGDSMFSKIKDAFGSLTDTLGQMQATLKSAQLLAIAAAVGILTASVVALSMIDTAQLYISLGAMGVMFAQLSGAMVILDKFAMGGGALKMAAIGGAMIGMATAMVILAAAVKIFSTMNWDELARGFAALAAGMGIMVGAMSLVHSKVFAAASMVLIASAMVILAGALKIMATMSWDDIFRAMTVLASSVGVLVGAMTLMKSKVFAAASILVIATAMTILAGALKIFGTMSWDEIGRSMTVLAGSLGILAGALALIHSKVFAAASLLVISFAMTVLSGALKVMASMSWDEIGRSMTVLAGSLAILAGAMALMGIPLVLLGAVGIVAASAAMMMLAPALVLLGTMSWDAIGRGLAMLASALGILAIGGVLLLPAIPAFMGLGTAIALIGAGVLLAGIGLTGLAAGITALAAAGTVGAEAIKMAVETLIALIPSALAAFAQGIIDFAVVIAQGGAEFAAAMTTLLMSLLQAIQTVAPEIIDTIWVLVVALVNKIVEGVPFFVNAGMALIIGVLNGIGNNIGQLIDAGVRVIVNFLDGIARNAKRLADAGFNTIITILEGVTRSIRENSRRFSNAAADLGEAIIDGIVDGITNFAGRLWKKITNIGNDIVKKMANILQINSPSKRMIPLGEFTVEGLVVGMDNKAGDALASAENVGNSVVNGMQQALDKASDLAVDTLDLNPVISPVLDLSKFESDASQISNTLKVPKLNLDSTYDTANLASSAMETNRRAHEEAGYSDGGDTIVYNQYNSSPKALSTAEIYRQTKNQISTVQNKNQPVVVTSK